MITKEQLSSLRELAGIAIPDNASNLETSLVVAQFTHKAFSHNGDNQPSRSDPITIFEEAQAGSQFRCVEYSHLAAWLMIAHGIEARTINIMMKDVETMEYGAGHVVVEFYAGEKHGWVMADIQAGVVARCNDKLQSAYELRESMENSTPEDFNSNQFVEPEGMFGGDYKKWLEPYLYFFDRPPELNYEYSVDTEPHLIIVPDGSEPPKYFQKTHELDLVVVNPDKFYEVPQDD
jgi:hypothetical protein